MAETEMVKRVARALRDADAIWAARKYADYPPEEIQRLIRESADECGYDELAYAAIEAMREPTKEMVVAGDDEKEMCVDSAYDSDADGNLNYYTTLDSDLPARVFRAMIDAALSPPSKD